MQNRSQDEAQFIADLLTVYRQSGRAEAYRLLSRMADAYDDGADRAELRQIASNEAQGTRRLS